MGRGSAPARFTSPRGRVPVAGRCLCAPPGAEERGRDRDLGDCWERARVLGVASGMPVWERDSIVFVPSLPPSVGRSFVPSLGGVLLVDYAFYSLVYRRSGACVALNSTSRCKVLCFQTLS